METEGARLAEFAGAVRESTLKRLQAVGVGRENWRATSTSMSYADLAAHLLEADRWLFGLLDDGPSDPVVGRPGLRTVGPRSEYDSVLSELEATGRHRTARIAGLTDAALTRRYFDRRFGRDVTLWWAVARGNLDHEIHHRGQISVYLRIDGFAS
jgi:uncharacterized damage-inducible protein DinB